MKQAVVTAPGNIIFQTVDPPDPASGQVLLRISRIGICGSDLHVFHGLHPYTSYPVVQGHEVSGVVAAIGPDVIGLAVGDAVTFMPQVTCGQCYSCRNGMEHICDNLKVMGFQTGGAAQEFFAVAAARVLKLPAGITLEQGAMIEPVSVAAHAIRRVGSVAGKKVLVIGAGPIGNLIAQVARAQGAAGIIITDLSEYRLDLAGQVGLSPIINPACESLDEAILQNFGPDRADIIFECVGVQATISQAIAVARKGSTIVVVGVFGKKPEVDIGLVQDRELSLLGTLMYQKQDYETALSLVERGLIQLDKLVTHRFPFADYLDAYRTIEAAKGRTMKVLVTLD